MLSLQSTMVSKTVVLLSFCFALTTCEALGAADGLRSLKNHADEARSVLSTIPVECQTDSHLITTEYVKTLYSIFNCSYSEVIDDAANIALEAGAFAALDYQSISKLLVKFTACAAELNPLSVIECDLGEIVSAYDDIKGMIVSTQNFINDMKSMIPPLEMEINNCLKMSSIKYKMFLNNLIHKARKCENAL